MRYAALALLLLTACKDPNVNYVTPTPVDHIEVADAPAPTTLEAK